MRCAVRYARAARRTATAGLAALFAGLGPAGCSGDLGTLEPLDPALVPDSVVAEFRDDAAVLALRAVLEDGGAASGEVELPDPFVDRFHDALLRVYATGHPARDSVVDLYGIRVLPSPSARSLIVGAGAGADWARAWADGERLTGYAPVDAIVLLYDLRLHRTLLGPAAVFHAPRPLNTVALAERFRSIPGVEYAESNGAVGARDIHGRPAQDGVRLDYRFGWGDCPAGCIHQHTWSFVVGWDGRVRYLGGSGDPPPPRRAGTTVSRHSREPAQP